MPTDPDLTPEALDALQEWASAYRYVRNGAELNPADQIAALRAQLATARPDALREAAEVAAHEADYVPVRPDNFRHAILALIDTPTPSAPSPEAVARAALEDAWREAVNVANDIGNEQRHGGAMDVVDAISHMASDPATRAAIIAKAGGGE